MRRHRLRPIALTAVVAAALALYLLEDLRTPVVQRFTGQRTVADVLRDAGPEADARLAPYMAEAGLSYPLEGVTVLVLKQERRLELWGRATPQASWRHVRDYPILGASGNPGPKLRQGDLQVPEGVYSVVGLNPNSAFHLSMKLNYPNAFDSARAAEEGRTDPGTDIFIHGKQASVGCVAVGDAAIEELFVLAAKVGVENVRVVLAPCDLRRGPPPNLSRLPSWVDGLYKQIQESMRQLDNPTKDPEGR
jgi:hypothetical protein